MYIQLHGFGQSMPTNPLVPKKWCPEIDQIQSELCFPYTPQEVAISRTAQGHLSPDVIMLQPGLNVPNTVFSCRHLIIRDFGVDWRHVKLAARNEQLLKTWMLHFESNKSLLFRITGYSDCSGVERNNFLLRRGRARNVFRLFGKNARSRVIGVIAALPKTYLTDNSTIAARAQNRSVVIEIFLNDSQII